MESLHPPAALSKYYCLVLSRECGEGLWRLLLRSILYLEGQGIVSRLISTLKGTLIGVLVLISPQNNQLLTPPTLQAGATIGIPSPVPYLALSKY